MTTTTEQLKRILVSGALAATLMGTAAVAFVSGAGTALAPEPARLTSNLSGSTGASAAAVYVHTSTPTTVVIWPSTYMGAPASLTAGTPCSIVRLTNGQVSKQVIVRIGPLARCA